MTGLPLVISCVGTGEMLTPTVREISHDEAVALQREWQRIVAAAAAKAGSAKS